MSYCRFAEDSDVYVYETRDAVICSGCSIERKFHAEFFKWGDIIEHLHNHEKNGDKVPSGAYLRLSRQRGRTIGEEW